MCQFFTYVISTKHLFTNRANIYRPPVTMLQSQQRVLFAKKEIVSGMCPLRSHRVKWKAKDLNPARIVGIVSIYCWHEAQMTGVLEVTIVSVGTAEPKRMCILIPGWFQNFGVHQLPPLSPHSRSTYPVCCRTALLVPNHSDLCIPLKAWAGGFLASP